MNKRIIARLLILVLLFGTVWLVRRCQQPKPFSTSNQQTEQSTPNSTQSNTPQADVPQYVLEVLQYVRSRGEAPEGYVGGREFQNREKKLPAKSTDGSRIRYSEWDVHPKSKGKNRGAERLVTGSDHSAWYTKDHYKHFKKID
jgi:ribonuclease T1